MAKKAGTRGFGGWYGVAVLGYLTYDAVDAEAQACDTGKRTLTCNTALSNKTDKFNDPATYTTCSKDAWGGSDESVEVIVPTGTRAVLTSWDYSSTLDMALFLQEDDCATTSKCTGMSDAAGDKDNAAYGLATQPYTTEERIVFTGDGSKYYATVDENKYGGWTYAMQLGCPTECAAPDVTAEITCSSDFVSSTKNGSQSLDFYECGTPFSDQLQNNPEAVYTFTPQQSGAVTFTLSGITKDQDLYVLEATCESTSCIAGATQASTATESITFTAAKGTTYYIVVEAYEAAGDYTLSFKDATGGCREDCDDKLDNDGDKAVDCADSDCALDPVCNCTVGEFYPDLDGDTFGDATKAPTSACVAPPGYVTSKTDCDDANKAVNPSAVEVCNGVDDDCDGVKDDGVTSTFYADQDKDTYGNAASTVQSCAAPAGYVSTSTDCKDTDATVYPGAPEICDLLDNDCDGAVDDNATGLGTWYVDGDGDKYGAGAGTQSCGAPGPTYVNNNKDCNDTAPAVNPAATEVCNGVDDDCDTLVDDKDAPYTGGSTYYADTDKDGYGNAKSSVIACAQPVGYVVDKTDCNDAAATVHPGAAEVPYDGIDQDCDGADIDDIDGDGFVAKQAGGTDCNDQDANTYLNATETVDGRDQDCDGKVDDGTNAFDDDGDGYTELGGDCNDAAAGVSPAEPEVCDGKDQDCDAVVDEGTACFDDDGDGETEQQGDCVDGDPAVNSSATEVQNNGIDDDCDGSVDMGVYDPDNDGFTEDAGDCDNQDATRYPGAPELADGLDNDCDDAFDEGTALADDDLDGTSEEEGDCDDTDATVHAGAAEDAGNGVDDDCDGIVDEGSPRTDDDGDGISEEGGDCDDANADVSPGVVETENGVDDDCDGEVDERFLDRDGDGFAGPDDCDDEDGWVNPDVGEFCDELDNNCDGRVDEGCGLDTGVGTGGGDCGCNSARGGGVGMVALLLGALARRRRAVTAR